MSTVDLTFDPPSNHAFEPELRLPAPRRVDERVLRGPYATSRRAVIARLFTGALVCFALQCVPAVETLAYYLLFLRYLGWIGLTLLAIAVGALVHYILRLGVLRYVREGQPLVARVARLETIPTGPNVYAYRALLVYRDPETGTVTHSAVKSRDIPPLFRHRFDLRLREGEYVTALYMPGRDVADSLRLYAFLDVSPDVNLRAAPGSSPVGAILQLIALFALVGVLLGDLYAMKAYPTLDAPWPELAVAAALGAVAIGWSMYLIVRRQGRGFLGALLSALLLGGMTGVCWALMLNAWLDRSPADVRPASVVELWHTTQYGLLRDYEIEYRLADGDKHKLLSSWQHMQTFESRRAWATVRAGAFGWRWVQSVDPAE
jgi:hypothetical protein